MNAPGETEAPPGQPVTRTQESEVVSIHTSSRCSQVRHHFNLLLCSFVIDFKMSSEE